MKCDRNYYGNGQVASETYCLNGNLHNDNGPAYREWYENGQVKYEIYYLKGKYHNDNGPAFRAWYENGLVVYETYDLDGVMLSKEKFEKRNDGLFHL